MTLDVTSYPKAATSLNASVYVGAIDGEDCAVTIEDEDMSIVLPSVLCVLRESSAISAVKHFLPFREVASAYGLPNSRPIL